jgi:hypothetical protein
MAEFDHRPRINSQGLTLMRDCCQEILPPRPTPIKLAITKVVRRWHYLQRISIVAMFNSLHVIAAQIFDILMPLEVGTFILKPRKLADQAQRLPVLKELLSGKNGQPVFELGKEEFLLAYVIKPDHDFMITCGYANSDAQFLAAIIAHYVLMGKSVPVDEAPTKAA